MWNTRGVETRRAMRSLVVLALVVCVMLMVAWPMVASGYLDLGGGSGVSPSYLAYTDWPKLHPDRVDEINARNAYLAYTDWPKLHPDRVDEINARR